VYFLDLSDPFSEGQNLRSDTVFEARARPDRSSSSISCCPLSLLIVNY
jgi:hypothetical protein